MAQTFTQDEVRELMRRMGESMLEVLDADSYQCEAWNRRGEELITAMISSPDPDMLAGLSITYPVHRP